MSKSIYAGNLRVGDVFTIRDIHGESPAVIVRKVVEEKDKTHITGAMYNTLNPVHITLGVGEYVQLQDGEHYNG